MSLRSLLLLNGFASLAVAAGAPEGQLTVKTGDLTVKLESSAAWTIRSVDLLGDALVIPAGGQGAVLVPAGGQWIGSVMGDGKTEPVTAFSVTADGQELELALPQTVTAEKVVLRKTSTLGPFRHEAETTFEGELVLQRHAFAAQQDATLKTFYAFIYSFVPAATAWLAQPLNGTIERGAFAGDGSHKPGAQCVWLAQYDAATGKGALAYYQTPFSGSGAMTRFWDTKGYHKLLSQPARRSVKKDDSMEYTLAMQFFAAPADAWEQRAQEIAAELEKRFPRQAVAAPPAAAPAERLYGEGVPETGMLICKGAAYTVSFEAGRAWTIHDMHFGDKKFSLNNGFYGTVLTPKGDRWWGTGHTEGGKEIVHKLKLLVDDEERPVVCGETVSGKRISLIKDSTIWKFKTHAEVTISDEHVYERTRLEALEDCELGVMYYFMHCFPPTTTTWLAELPDGETESGALTHSDTMQVTKNTRWTAQFDPGFGIGILCYTPKVITGARSASMIWDKERYHKYYLRQNQGQAFKAGEVLDYEVLVKAVPNETGDWSVTKAAAAALKQEFPPQPDQ